MAEGALFFLGFSGFILSEEHAVLADQTVYRAGYRLVVKTPVRLARPTWRPIPQLTPEDLSRVAPGLEGAGQFPLRLAVIPQIDDDGNPALMTVVGDENPEWSKFPRDTIAVAVYGDDAMDKGASLAEQVVRDLFSWLRILTKQWWVGRPAEGITGNLHAAFQLSQEDHTTGSPVLLARQTSPPEGARRVSTEVWETAFSKIREHALPKFSDTAISNAQFLYFSGEHELCIINICTSLEIERDIVLENKGIAKNALKSDTDILKHLSLDFERIFSRNLKNEHPRLFDFLRSLWIARGNVAHGKNLVWIQNGSRVKFRDIPPPEIFSQVEKIARWITSM